MSATTESKNSENVKLESSPAIEKVVETQKEPAHAPDFATVVEQSRIRLAEESAGQEKSSTTAPGESKKTGPGRPRKCPVHGKSVRECGCENIQAASKKKEVTENPEVLPSAFDIADQLTAPIQAISKIPAQRHQIPELAFDLDESRACAGALKNVIEAFSPNLANMDPRAAAILSAGIIFGSIGFTKFQIYAHVTDERRRARQNSEVAAAQSSGQFETVDATNARPPFAPGAVLAEDHFRRQAN